MRCDGAMALDESGAGDLVTWTNGDHWTSGPALPSWQVRFVISILSFCQVDHCHGVGSALPLNLVHLRSLGFAFSELTDKLITRRVIPTSSAAVNDILSKVHCYYYSIYHDGQ